MNEIKVIVFDHDGVIIRLSDVIKQGAWLWLADHEDIGDLVAVAEAVQHNARVMKGNRFDVLKRVFEKLGKSPEEIPGLVKKHADRFNMMVQGGILNLGIASDDKETLRHLSEQYSLYINTGTTEEAMQETAAALGYQQFFKGVYGQPTGKVENLERARKNENVTKDQMVLVGDGDSDYKAAQKFGCHFIGFANLWNEWKNKPFPLIKSLSEITEVLEKLT